MTGNASIRLVLLALSCATCWLINVARADTGLGIIKAHGEYSSAYRGDWSKLPNGKDMARKDRANRPIETLAGDDAKRWYSHQDQVHISGASLQVSWPGRDYDNQVFRISDVKTVIIEDVAVVHTNPDYRGYHSVLIENCDTAVIRNSSFAGAVEHSHIKIKGCRDVLIDNVEIAGIDYDKSGRHRSGGGIFIENGNQYREGSFGGPGWRELEWLVIQNCYIHDLTGSDGTRRNHDAIIVHTPADGVIFNNVIENWLDRYGDAAIDVGFRRPGPPGRFLRIERNIVRNANRTKTPGEFGDGSSAVLWANNVMINVFHGDYHEGWSNHFVHNTYIWDRDKLPLLLEGEFALDAFYKLWTDMDYPSFGRNNLLSVDVPGQFWVTYQSGGKPDKYRNLHTDHSVYLTVAPTNTGWLVSDGDSEGPTFRGFEDWKRDTGNDRHSLLGVASPEGFVDYDAGDYRLSDQSPAKGAGSAAFAITPHRRMAVTRDFLGKPRSTTRPSAGAFE